MIASLARRVVAPLALVAAVVLLMAPACVDRVVDMRDAALFTYPSRHLWAERVGAGELPEWNPGVGLGTSVLAAPVHGVFYPPNALLLAGDRPTMFSLLLGLHLLWAGLGGWLLARRLGCRGEAALVAGLVCSVGGYAVSMLGNGEKVFTGAWLPWIVLGCVAVATATRDRLARALAGAGAALAMMALAGDPFVWFDAALVAAPLAVAVAGRWSWRLVGRLAAVAGLGLLLAAPALVPAVAYVGQSDRAGGLGADEAEAWSTAPGDLAGLVHAGHRHSPDPVMDGAWAPSLYVGLAALAALLVIRGRVAWALWGCAAVAAVLAFGRHTPIHGWLRDVIPPLGYMRYPEKHAVALVVAIALLAALGWERALAAAETRWPGRARRLAWLLPLLAGIDLLVAAMPHMRWADAEVLRTPSALVKQLSRPGPAPARVARSLSIRWSLATMPHNHGMQFGLAHVPGHDPAQARRLREYWEALERDGMLLARRLRVDYALLPGAEGLQVVAIPEVPPRLVVTGAVEVVDDAAARSRLADRGFDDRAVSLVAPGGAARALDGAGPAGSCELTRYEPEAVDFACDVQRPGLAVLADGYADGWSARVDGAAAPVVRANVVMRGVYVEPGRRLVQLRFEAPGRDLGLALGALGLAVVGGLLWRGRRRGAVEPAPPAPAATGPSA